MKLDMDLGREIMLAIEADPEADGTGLCEIEIEGRSEHEIAYQGSHLGTDKIVR